MPGKYPDWLIQRVARAFWDTQVQPEYDYDYLYRRAQTTEGDYAEILADLHKGATQALDALGFTRDFALGRLVGGMLTYAYKNEGADWHERWTARTEWKEVEE